MIKITTISPGYAHERISGTYDKEDKLEDVERRFRHPVFGGRIERFSDGHFTYIKHTD